MSPPTGLKVAASGSSVIVSWTPPAPAPVGYVLFAGSSPDNLAFTTSSVPGGVPSLDVWDYFGTPRGTPFFVALASYRTSDNGYSAPSNAVQVTLPVFDPGTIEVDCAVAHVNGAEYLPDPLSRALLGTYESGGCVTGTFRSMAMSAAFDRIYGATYSLDGVGRILDLGVVSSSFVTDPDTMDGPWPSIRIRLSPVASVLPGSSWNQWAHTLTPGSTRVFGGIFDLDAYYLSTRLRGLATDGTLIVTSASGLDQPGQGTFRIQGSVTFSDPFSVPGVCDQVDCD
jgi:hypothetical protein